MPDDLLRVSEVAEMLDISPSSVRRLPADLLPTADVDSPHRYYRRQDVLECKAVLRASTPPTKRLDAIVLSTLPTETARHLQTAGLVAWAAGQNFAVVALAHSLDDALQYIWDGHAQAVIVQNLATLGTKDARILFAALCTMTGVELVQTHAPTPYLNAGEEVIKLAGDTLSDLLATAIDPAVVQRLLDYGMQQWKRALAEHGKQNEDNGHQRPGRHSRSQ